MNQDPANRIPELERQVAELMDWKRQREQQQLVFPLDQVSKEIIAGNFLTVVNEVNFVRSNGKEVPLYLIVQSNGKKYTLTANNALYTFTAATSDVITVSSQFDLENDMQLVVFTEQVLPGGLDPDTIYYTINASGKTAKLSLSSGGSAVDITSTGTGLQYLYFV